MKVAITHENFDSAIDRCKKGLTGIAITTAYRVTLIKAKHLKQWENAGMPLLQKDTKSNGFYLQRGKTKDYIFESKLGPYLFEVSI